MIINYSTVDFENPVPLSRILGPTFIKKIIFLETEFLTPTVPLIYCISPFIYPTVNNLFCIFIFCMGWHALNTGLPTARVPAVLPTLRQINERLHSTQREISRISRDFAFH